MSKEPTDDDNDSALFRESLGDVKRLRTDKVMHPKPKPPPRPEQTRRDEVRIMDEILVSEYDAAELQPGDVLSFCRPGLQKTAFRKLRRGQYRVNMEIDLHGMTAAIAQQALNEFMREAKAQDARCVRIVHGKGHGSNNRGPVIKPLVNRWLGQRNDVLAFCSARPVDGGTGAVYVLLKAS